MSPTRTDPPALPRPRLPHPRLQRPAPQRRLRVSPVLALAAGLAGCTPEAAPASEGLPTPSTGPLSTTDPHPFIPPVVFRCGPDGVMRLVVAFKDDHAEVTLPDGSKLTLPQQPAASGFWYATPRHVLRGKGQDATWTVGRAVPLACRAEPPAY